MIRTISSYIFHKILGRQIIGELDPQNTKKCILLVVPHTSWHDFLNALLVRQIIGLKMSFLGKKELFAWPIGWYFKKVGGIPLDRTPGQNKVDAIAQLFAQREELRLTIAPEGTRKKVTRWKTGFYFIAKKAKIPIVLVAFDFGNKQTKISAPFFPTDDQEADFRAMYQFYKGVQGKIAKYSFEPPEE